MVPARAPAQTLPPGFKPAPETTTLVERVARRRPTHSNRPSASRYQSPKKSSWQSRQRDRSTWKKKRDRQATSPRDPRYPPGTDKRPDKGPRHPGRRRPPIYIPPPAFDDDPSDSKQAQQPLPRRVERAPQGRQLQAQRVARQILVLVDQSRSPAVATQLARTYGLQMVSSRPIMLLNARATVFRVRAGRSEDVALAALQRDPRVRSAQFNMRYQHSDAKRGGPAGIDQYGPRVVRLPDAHRLALGRNVVIAVIDSAVDKSHPDLKGAVAHAFDVVGGKDAGADFHGTAVAGIIRSRGVVAGVAPQAWIMSVRAFQTSRGALPETTTERLLAAVDLAVAKGARVLNMSFVGGHDRQLHEILQVAGRRGVVLVAAAGNGGPKAAPAYPAAYPEVIAVTAVDEGDNRYEHANRGRYIAIAAPGVDILAPVQGGRHELVSGTSFATAYVSGIAALLLERNPGMDTAAIAKLIAAGADDLGPAGHDDDFGAGRVNALKALSSMAEIAANLQGSEDAGKQRQPPEANRRQPAEDKRSELLP
jgi:subtilisin family serine protease